MKSKRSTTIRKMGTQVKAISQGKGYLLPARIQLLTVGNSCLLVTTCTYCNLQKKKGRRSLFQTQTTKRSTS